jgi:hypothetical protein
MYGDPAMGKIPIFVASADKSMEHTGPDRALPTLIFCSSCRPAAADAAIKAQRDQQSSVRIKDDGIDAWRVVVMGI